MVRGVGGLQSTRVDHLSGRTIICDAVVGRRLQPATDDNRIVADVRPIKVAERLDNRRVRNPQPPPTPSCVRNRYALAKPRVARAKNRVVFVVVVVVAAVVSPATLVD